MLRLSAPESQQRKESANVSVSTHLETSFSARRRPCRERKNPPMTRETCAREKRSVAVMNQRAGEGSGSSSARRIHHGQRDAAVRLPNIEAAAVYLAGPAHREARPQRIARQNGVRIDRTPTTCNPCSYSHPWNVERNTAPKDGGALPNNGARTQGRPEHGRLLSSDAEAFSEFAGVSTPQKRPPR